MPKSKQAVVFDDRPPKRKPSARSSAKAKRTAARLTAVQILYQAHQLGASPEKILKEFHDYRIGQIIDELEIIPADEQLLAGIIEAASDNAIAIDALLEQSLRGTTLERLEQLLRVIMQAAIGELLIHRDIETGIIISDYLSVTDAFYDKAEIKLVNGVLDAAARDIRTILNTELTTELKGI
jgi:N utilization substance protein B